MIGKCPRKDTHLLTNLQCTIKLQHRKLVCRANQRFDDPMRHRVGAAIGSEERTDAERAVDRAPTLSLRVKMDEQVPGKSRRFDFLYLTRVTDGFDDFRKKGPETLPLQLKFSSHLPTRQSMHNVPTFPAVTVNIETTSVL